MRWGGCQQAEASRSCTTGWPGLKHKLPASVQPSAPCHGGDRGHLVKPAAAVGRPAAGECCERVDLATAWQQPASWAGQQSLGSLGCRESWNQAVEKTADAALLAPEQGSDSAPVPGTVLL